MSASLSPMLPVTLPVQPVVGRARAQLASPVDGRFGAMDPRALLPLIERLLADVDVAGIDYVLGIPEGGNVPAFAFAMRAGLRLVLGSHWRPAHERVITFVEEHDTPPFAAKHVSGLARGDRVLVVEDEVTSGRTIVNCVRALRAAGVHCDTVASVYAADDASMRERVAAEGIRLVAACLCRSDTNTRLYGG